MAGAERRALTFWLILSALAAIPLFFGWLLILLIFTGIGIPAAMLLNLVPTVWLYVTVILLLYLLLRLAFRRVRVSRTLLAGVSSVITVGTGIAIPLLANREVERQVAAIMARDMGSEPLVEPVESVAILVDAGLGSTDGKCWDECQRLLFSGLARNVMHGSLDALSNLEQSPTPLVRHSIVPFDHGCDNTLLYGTRASREEWDGPPPVPYLWNKLADFAARGECFRSDRTRDARADLYLVRTYNFDPERQRRGQPEFDLRLIPVERFQRREVFRREGGRLIPLMRRTQVRFSRLAVPLQITPPFTFDTHMPGHWTYAGTEERGSPPTYNGMMRHWLRNDLRISGLGADRAEVVVSARREANEQ